jgi:hypothetical protein
LLGVLAFDGDMPVGMVNCIEGFSTLAMGQAQFIQKWLE